MKTLAGRGPWGHAKSMLAHYKLKKIQIEVVNLCNFRCPLCPTTIKDHVIRKRMTFQEYQDVMTPILKDLEEITFFGTKGEPLLNNELEDMIEFSRLQNPQLQMGISTNGSLLTPERSERLMRAGLDKLVVGIDGITQESFGDYRVGGNLEDILSHLKFACELKSKHNFKTLIVWQFIPMKKNEDQIRELEQLAFDLGVDVVSVKLSRSVAESERFRTLSAQYIPEVINQDHFVCPSGTDKLYIDPNGDVFPCCFGEGHELMKIGNAFQTPLLDMWQGHFLQRLRQSFEQQKPWDFCERECRGVCHKEKINIKRNKYPKKSLAHSFELK